MRNWLKVYCPNCLHEEQVDEWDLQDGQGLRCKYCEALMAEYQDLPNRARVKAIN